MLRHTLQARPQPSVPKYSVPYLAVLDAHPVITLCMPFQHSKCLHNKDPISPAAAFHEPGRQACSPHDFHCLLSCAGLASGNQQRCQDGGAAPVPMCTVDVNRVTCCQLLLCPVNTLLYLLNIWS